MRLSFVDFLRFIAASAVLFQHLFEVVAPAFFKPFLDLAPGVFGVVLFFLISGYIIPFSVRRGFSLGDFAVRRAFRIFPAYLLVLAAVIALGVLGVAPWRDALELGGIPGLAANLFIVQDYFGLPAFLGVSWTLAIEFIWYAAFAFLMILFWGRYVVLLCILGSLGLMALAATSLVADVRLPLGRAGMLNAALFGYAAYMAHMGRVTNTQFRGAAVLFLGALAISQWVSFGYFEHPNITLFNGLAGWLLAAALFLVFHQVQRLREVSLFSNPFVLRLGESSYSLYLTHGPIMVLCALVMDPLQLLVAVPVISVALSLLLYRTVELPGIAAGKLVAGHFPRPKPTSAFARAHR